MEHTNNALVEALHEERALLIQFEEIERERSAKALASIEGKGDAVVERLAAYCRSA